jgi:signal transduction histidine kinase
LLSGVFLTSVGAFAFTGALFALLHSRRPSSEHRLVALLSIVSAATTFALAESPTPSPGSPHSLAARLGLLLAFGLVAQLGLRGAPTHSTPRVALVIQIALAGTAALDVSRAVDARLVAILALAAGAAAAGLLLASVSRGYIAGRKELGGVILGSGVLIATVAIDALFEVGVLSTGNLLPIGFLALLAGMTAKLALEYTNTRLKLDARKRELRTRTRELRHSHHELKAAQAELSTKEQLAAVGELAAVVAHEVRNPLAILGNAVSSLRKPNLASQDRTTLLEIIDSEATRLNRIVTDLLSFSRPITVQRGSVDLGEIVDRALSLATRPSDVTVDLQMIADDARVWADSNLLRQVMDNLIENAMQAMDGGGTLTVRVFASARNGDDLHADPGGGVIVEVIDTGEGMDTLVRSRAKDPFFTTRPSGTGLGLAIVDRIVDAHGGRFEIESRAGQGTKVTVRLPAASSDPPSSRSSQPEEEALSKGDHA